MEATLEFKMLGDTPVAEMVAEETTKEIDDILDEVVNLAKIMEVEETVFNNVVADREEAVDETDFGMKTGDYLELEINLPMETTEPPAKTTPLAEETESAFDALIDAENEVMAALANEVGANDPGDSLLAVAGKDSDDKAAEKSLAEDSNTREEGVCNAPVENTVSDETYGKFPANNEQSPADFLVNQESESEVEEVSASVAEASTPHSSSDHLTDMLGKKIEATIARLVEERLSIIVERSIAEKFERILANIA